LLHGCRNNHFEGDTAQSEERKQTQHEAFAQKELMMPDNKLQDEILARVKNHDQATDAIVARFFDEVTSRKIPSTIYHFTDDAGMRGILEKGHLWCTDQFSLNDPSEFKYGMGIARKILRSKIDQGPEEALDFYHEWSNSLARGMESIARFFVCCFSETDEDLSQWRAYADDACGFALGFDAKILEKHFTSEPEATDYLSFPMSYDDDKLRDLLNQIMAETVPIIFGVYEAKLDVETRTQYLRQLRVMLAMRCAQVALCFKHPAFQHEKEYRLLRIYPIGTEVPDLRLRSRPYELVKYTEFDWKSTAANSLTKIVMGPGSDIKKSSKYAYDCLHEFMPGCGDCSIEHSKIPYRSLQS
jgi:hypothetical protein